MAAASDDRAPLSYVELGQAARNHALPLEALRHDVTPLGLHYLLIHYDIPHVDAGAWRLTIDGRVRRPLTLTLEELRARPSRTLRVTLECAGNGRALMHPRVESQPWLSEAVGTADWTGVPLAALLAEADPLEDAVDVRFTGLDRGVEGGVEQQYERALSLDEARGEDVLLAWGVNGAPLPPQHGFPLRLLVPGWYGMASVKWLERIHVLEAPFAGYQHTRAYRLWRGEDDPGDPVTRIEPRALMVPPGLPEFPSRRRVLDPGHVTVEGRAWSGHGPIDRVEFSSDGGATWADADLSPPAGRWAWRRWTAGWDATIGHHELRCRARDATGRLQPDAAAWNRGGYANNGAQRVAVEVRPLPGQS